MRTIKGLLFMLAPCLSFNIVLEKKSFEKNSQINLFNQRSPVDCVRKFIHYQESQNIDSLITTVNCSLYMNNINGVKISSENEIDYCTLFKEYTMWQWQLSERIWKSKQDRIQQDSLEITETNYSTLNLVEITNLGNSVILVDSTLVFNLHRDNCEQTWFIFKKDVYNGSNFKL